MGQSWYGATLVPGDAKRRVAGTSAISSNTGRSLHTRDPEPRPAKTGRSRLGCLGPVQSTQETGDSSVAPALPTRVIPDCYSKYVKETLGWCRKAQDCLAMWKKPPRMRGRAYGC